MNGWGGRAALALAILVAAVPTVAQPADTLRSKREALGEVRRRLETEREQASAARRREVSLLAELEGMERSLTAKRADLARLDQRIRWVERELLRLTGERGRVAEDTVSHRAALAARLRALARLRQTPAPPAPLTAASDLARARRADVVARVSRLDLERLAVFGEAAERLRTRHATVEDARREQVALRGRVQTERAALAAETTRRRALLTEVRENRATHERMAAELEDASRRLEALVRELARRAQARRVVARPRAEAGSRGPAIGLGALRGQLPWPAEGRVVAGFGRQVHPRFGTETFRRGVDIEAEEGTPIRAVYAGTVLYRGWVKGYGNLIVLDHGADYYTLYGHASGFLVEDGQPVTAGQAIGRVGETGSLEGPRLYFEVRYAGRAEDPEAWLKRRL